MKTMKTIAMLLVILTTGLSMHAQEKGNVIRQDRAPGTFTDLMINQPVKVMLSQGDASRVSVEAPEKIQEKIIVKAENNQLSLDVKTGELQDVRIFVTVKDITKIHTSGSATLEGETVIRSGELFVKADGASSIQLDVDLTTLRSDISGAAEVQLKGKTDRHDSRLSGAANLKAVGLATKTTEIKAGGASYAGVDASEELTGTVSGAANLTYKSKPPVYSIQESGAASSGEADTTRLKFGDKHVLILDSKRKGMKYPGGKDFGDSKGKKSNVGFKVVGLDLGVNGYLNSDFRFKVPAQYSYLSPNYGRSWGFGLDFFHIGVPLVRNTVKLWFGPGFEFNHYAFSSDYMLTTDTSAILAHIVPGVSYDKNKLTVAWFRVPVVMQFNIKKFNFSVGVIGAVKTGSHTLHVWKDGGTTKELKTKHDFYLNPFKADATFRIGYGQVNLFANYTFTGMYRKGYGPEVYPVTMGISCNLYGNR